jgi:hypothetical protein
LVTDKAKPFEIFSECGFCGESQVYTRTPEEFEAFMAKEKGESDAPPASP